MHEQYKKDFLEAGALAKKVRSYGLSLIKKGSSYNDVIQKIRRKIADLGAVPAFPPQIALDFVAAHYLPDPIEDIIFSNQLIKLDIGVCYNGAIGDCAATVDLSGKHQKIIDAAEAALLAAENSIKVDLPIREIGRIIEKTITSFGLHPIRNLAGHGLGFYKIHTPPSIPNYDDKSAGLIKPGMTFAIEPFATSGKGLIYEAKNPTIFCFAKPNPLKSQTAIALLSKIKLFDGLPFAIHDLVGPDAPLAEVKKALTEMLSNGVIHGYGPLIEEAKGMVAQAENSVLVDMDGRVFITTR